MLAAILMVSAGFTGCLDDEDNDADELTGTATYPGTWGGTGEGDDMSGTWEYEVDFDAGTVSGSFADDFWGDISGSVDDGVLEADGETAFGKVEWEGNFSSDGEDVSGTWEAVDVSGYFQGDAAGDISGSVSDGQLNAEGDAALGHVTWWGTFSANGSEIPGDWEIEEQNIVAYSGTWSGQEGELENGNGDDDEDEEPPLPDEDQESGDEPVERYPDSIMLSHTQVTGGGQTYISITYGTMDSIDDVVNWYEGELGTPDMKQTEGGVTSLYFDLDGEGTEMLSVEISADDYTSIEVEYSQE
ncbi:MAG: hypothetical protein R6U17_06990 [Thermoplasmata archaeon]